MTKMALIPFPSEWGLLPHESGLALAENHVVEDAQKEAKNRIATNGPLSIGLAQETT